MLQTEFRGQVTARLLKRLVSSDIDALSDGSCKLSLFLNESGGIIDDAIVTKVDADNFRVVSNASRAERLLCHIMEHGSITSLAGFKPVLDQSLLALQGPDSANHLEKIIPGLATKDIGFMQSKSVKCDGAPLIVSRCGYTGEDGFEISIPNAVAESVATRILDGGVPLAGLAVRDIMRLEAGLLLNGQDLDETTVPSEVGLGWLLSKSRADYLGYPVPKRSKKLVGLIASRSGPIPRHGTELRSADGNRVGVVTSGCYSPMLDRNICFGKLDDAFAGSTILALIRGTEYDYAGIKLPFVPHRFKRN
jgi:aminomethyltransferase